MNGILSAMATAAGLLLCTVTGSGAFEAGSFQDYGSHPSVFGSVALQSRLPDAIERLSKMDFSALPACGKDRECIRRAAVLDAATARAAEATDPFEALKLANRTVNHSIRYVPDEKSKYGVDEWASPVETIAAGQGDCEDYAILKMGMLLKAGVPAEAMAIAVVKLKDVDAYHAVLIVAGREADWVLDLDGDEIRSADAPSRYMPLYSLSASRSWLHGHKVTDRLATAAGS